MSVAVGNSSNAINNGGSSVTISHVTQNQTNRLLLVSVDIQEANAANRVVSGVTYNGIALTLAGAIERTGGGTAVRTEIWYLIAPPVGTFNVVVTMGGTCGDLSANAQELWNARQAAPEAVATSNSGGSSITTNITTIANNAFVFDSCTGDKTNAFTPGAGQTQTYQNNMTGSAGTGSHKTLATPTATSMTQSQTGAARLAHVLVSIAPVLPVNVFDSVTVAEAVTVQNPTLPADVFDSVSVVEAATVQNPTIPQSVFDSISVVEDRTVFLDELYLFTFEPFGILITEVGQISPFPLFVGVTNADITVQDFATTFLDVLNVSEFSEASIAEFTAQYLDNLVPDVFDNITAQEEATLNVETSVDVEDFVSVNEASELYPFDLFAEVFTDVLVEEAVTVRAGNAADVFDDILAEEAVEILLPELYLSVSETITISEIDNEDQIQGLDPIPTEVGDDVFSTEAVNLYPDPLFADTGEDVEVFEIALVIDPFIKSVGPAIEFIGVQDVITLIFPDNLHAFGPDKPTGLVGQYTVVDFAVLSVLMNLPLSSDTVGITEFAAASVQVRVSVFDTAAVSEQVEVVRDPQFSVFDFVSTQEFVKCSLNELNVFRFSGVFVDEPQTVLRRDPLHASGFDVIALTEFATILDLIVEAGPAVSEAAIVSEFTAIVILTPQLNISAVEVIGVNAGNVFLARDPLALSVFDALAVTESVFGHDEEIDFAVFDNVVVAEARTVNPPFSGDDLAVSAADDVLADEQAALVLPLLRTGVLFEAVLLEEAIELAPSPLRFLVFSPVAVQDVFVPEGIPLNVNVAESVSITERLVARDSLFQETPRLFEFRPRVRVFTSKHEGGVITL